jgi:branched-chain amino acid transport system substrate-binding protein
MSRRLIAVFALVVVAGVATGLAGGALGGGKKKDAGTILFGISAAKTGALAPYDLQPGQAFQMRIAEIDKAGGVLGKQIKVKWIDTKSDKPTAATNAQELISEGAVVIIGTCDFDYSFPALNAAAQKKVLGMSLCASSPKVATPAIVGQYAGSMGEGSDTEGTSMAEWLRKTHPSWKRAYVVKDTSLEYSKATADYFAAAWQKLGGTISGSDTFVGGTTTLDLSSQITRLRGKVKQTDVIYDGSWLPYGATFIRQVRSAGIGLPIATNNSVDGTLLTSVAGKISNVYSMGSVCIPSYCSGAVTPDVAAFFANFKKKYHVALSNSYPTRGYDLATAIVAAIKKAKSTDGPSVAKALFSGAVIKTMSGPVKFTEKCHRPQPPSHIFELYTHGKAKSLGRIYAKNIPNIGDGNPCAGRQAAPPK